MMLCGLLNTNEDEILSKISNLCLSCKMQTERPKKDQRDAKSKIEKNIYYTNLIGNI